MIQASCPLPWGPSSSSANWKGLHVLAARDSHLGANCCSMIVLVDYDNVRLRRRSLRYFVTRLLDSVGVRWCSGESLIHFRLYGGWFDGHRRSKGAQRLVPEIEEAFPRRMTVSDGASTARVRVTVELASSLVGDRPAMTHTYRRRSLPAGITCARPPFSGCGCPSQCPIEGIAPFIHEDVCPHPSCNATPHSVLARNEQKLVDSMMVVDLLRLAQTTSELLVLVSSDDDLWPGIRGALLHEAHVLHIHGRRSPSQYQPLTTKKYSQIAITW